MRTNVTSRRKYFALLTLILMGGTSAAVAQGQSPNPDEVYINGIHQGGTGCPQGTVDAYVSDDAKAFTLIFDQYVVEAGPGLPYSDSRKFCNIALDLQVPHGWQYSVFKVDYRGFAALDRGTYGMQMSRYRFSGVGGRDVTLSTRLRGPYTNDYKISDELGFSSLVWSPCGVNRALNINSSAFVRASRGSSALLTVDTIDGEFFHIYGMKWRRCN